MGNTTSASEDEMQKRSQREWENVVDKQIRQAMERGDFDTLPGNGKPLDLTVNPFVPEEIRQAYRILENAGVSPDWIERDKEIRVEKIALQKLLSDHAQWQRESTARSRSLAPDQIIADYEDLVRARDLLLARFRERAAALNKLIDIFNLKAPSSRVHHGRIQIEAETERFLAASKK
jgi:DnaJ-like protein